MKRLSSQMDSAADEYGILSIGHLLCLCLGKGKTAIPANEQFHLINGLGVNDEVKQKRQG